MTGIVLLLVLRYLVGLYHFFAGLNKLRQGWLWSDKLHQVFTERLTDLDPETIEAAFLQNFGIPMSMPIAWVVTIVEFAVATSLFLGYRTRAGALMIVVFPTATGSAWTTRCPRRTPGRSGSGRFSREILLTRHSPALSMHVRIRKMARLMTPEPE